MLVTVDPARDTPAAFKRYVDQFDPAFTGLTGSQAQLAPVYTAYHVVHEVKGDDIEHSTSVQFISPTGRLADSATGPIPPTTSSPSCSKPSPELRADQLVDRAAEERLSLGCWA